MKTFHRLLLGVCLVCFKATVHAQVSTIFEQPTDQTVLLGDDAYFSVTVSGSEPLSYQWEHDGTNLLNDEIVTVAGNGNYGAVANATPALDAPLSSIWDLKVDASGSLFIAAAVNFIVCKVDDRGIITTIAGTGTPGGSGDGDYATNAELNYPDGVAVDGVGNVFISDAAENNVREVRTDGIIVTFAGSGTNGYYGDGGPATKAELSHPSGLAFDTVGNLFIADTHNNRIRKVGTNGIISTVAGGGTGGDGGYATNAALSEPLTVALDASSDLLIAEAGNNKVRAVGTNGIIRTLAGTGAGTYSGDGGPATNAALNFPSGVAVDGIGNVFIADFANNRIRMVATNGVMTTVAGTGRSGFGGDLGSATNAELALPQAVTFGPSGQLFIADSGQRVREVIYPGPKRPLVNVSGANAGTYDVVISNAYGSVTSAVVTLKVALNPLTSVRQGQGVQLQFQGVASNSYVLQSASNLAPPVDWNPVVTNFADSNGAWSFTVSNTLSNGARFYRISTAGP